MIKKVEVLANIAIIVTSVVLCSVLVKKYFFVGRQTVAAAKASPPSQSADAPAKIGLQAGKKISLPGIDWSNSSRTVLLALSTTCHFCTESAPFYQKLQRQKPDNVQLVAILPQTVEDGRKYLDHLGVSV